MKNFIQALCLILTLLLFSGSTSQAQWVSATGPWVQTSYSYVNSILVIPDGNDTNLVASTFFGGIYHSTNNGTNWTTVNNGLTHLTVKSLALHPDGRDIFAATSNGGVFRSTDFGKLWVPINEGLPNMRAESFCFNEGYVFVGTHAGVYRSSNNGDNWSFSGSQGLVYSFAVKPNGSGGNYIFTANMGGVHRSSDNGLSWEPVNNGITQPFMMTLAVHDNYLFAGGEGGVYRSSDNGDSWITMNNGFSKHNVWYVVPVGTKLFAGVSSLQGGVFVSANNGQSWTAVNQGLSGEDFFVICFAHTSGYIYTGTGGNGIYKRLLSDVITSVQENTSGLPLQYQLHQNYPNPFNPATKINYQLPSAGHVSLKVYDITGKEVASLVNGFVTAGYHTAEFDAGSLASGIYYYTLSAGSNVHTKKMMLIK